MANIGALATTTLLCLSILLESSLLLEVAAAPHIGYPSLYYGDRPCLPKDRRPSCKPPPTPIGRGHYGRRCDKWCDRAHVVRVADFFFKRRRKYCFDVECRSNLSRGLNWNLPLLCNPQNLQFTTSRVLKSPLNLNPTIYKTRASQFE
ncbi:unnamed protein product [Lactuca virosa]|uniref:Uncharacterized protein n=1 Tax=Lactuca virosa TaxID=75947 RepID=A0AAU9NU74_9ASTR|nr:unnamed protein product [Lactuca virosa]